MRRQLTPEVTRELERRVVLSVLDRKWREHLYEMDYLKEGIGLRAMAQRDPLIEYQREGFDMFAAMLDSLKEESVGFLYNLQVQVVQPGAETADGTADTAGSNGASLAGDSAAGNGSAGGNGAAGGNGSAGVPGSRKRARVRPVAALPTQEAEAARTTSPAAAGTLAPAVAAGQGPVGTLRGRRFPGPDVLRAERGRCIRDRRQACQSRCGDGIEGAGSQRSVPVRLRQEVQDVPRQARRGRLIWHGRGPDAADGVHAVGSTSRPNVVRMASHREDATAGTTVGLSPPRGGVRPRVPGESPPQEGGRPMSGRVVHFEIPYDDAERSAAFYRDTFGWNTMAVPGMAYTMVGTGPAGESGMPAEPGYIGGGLTPRGDVVSSPVITVEVDDIEGSVAAVEAHGGSLVHGREPVGNMGWTAYVRDPEGNVVGLWQTAPQG